MNSKRKGSGGERELAELLQAHGYDAHRNDQRYIGGLNNPDVGGLPGYHIEVKRTDLSPAPRHKAASRVSPCGSLRASSGSGSRKRLPSRFNLYEAMQQAQHDADGKAVPIVCHRRNRHPWVVVMALEDFLNLEQDRPRRAD